MVMRGDAAAALSELAAQYADGADPMAVLRDLAEVSHWISVIKITPEAADDPTVSPDERARGQAMAANLAVRVLSRMWQMLLKALEEVGQAPNAMMAAEMAMIRLTHVADLPDRDAGETRLTESRPTPPSGSIRQRTAVAARSTGRRCAPRAGARASDDGCGAGAGRAIAGLRQLRGRGRSDPRKRDMLLLKSRGFVRLAAIPRPDRVRTGARAPMPRGWASARGWTGARWGCRSSARAAPTIAGRACQPAGTGGRAQQTRWCRPCWRLSRAKISEIRSPEAIAARAAAICPSPGGSTTTGIRSVTALGSRGFGQFQRGNRFPSDLALKSQAPYLGRNKGDCDVQGLGGLGGLGDMGEMMKAAQDAGQAPNCRADGAPWWWAGWRRAGQARHRGRGDGAGHRPSILVPTKEVIEDLIVAAIKDAQARAPPGRPRRCAG